MLSKLLPKIALTALMLAVAVPAAGAQVFCGQRPQIVSALGEKYHESRQAMGLVGQEGKGVLELFVSDKGTWTMLMTTAKGDTCIVATGLSWQASAKQAAGAGT
jgi:hypothetical protein